MAPSLHSQFSASASYRLLACPGSYEASRTADTGRKSSIFSAEGTLAHSISEATMFAGTDPSALVGRTMQADGFAFNVDEAMVENIKVYTNLLKGIQAMGYVIILEQRVSPQWAWDAWGLADLNIDLFGTCDCIAYNPATRHLMIVDLKYGRGVAVEVQGNPQLLYYGSGALNPDILKELCTRAGVPVQQPTDVSLVICQPRAPHPDGPIRKEDYTYEEVMNWNRDTLYTGVQRAMLDGGKTLAPGKHCRFCPVATSCAALRDYSIETARLAFRAAPIENIPADPTPDQVVLPDFDLSDARLGQLLDRIAVVGPWMEGLRAVAIERMNAGRDIPGWKQVPKAARRHWATGDTDAELREALLHSGLTEDEFTSSVIMSPAAVERKVGKKRYVSEVQPHVGKSSSGVTLAPEGDPRSRLSGRTAKEAFALPSEKD